MKNFSLLLFLILFTANLTAMQSQRRGRGAKIKEIVPQANNDIVPQANNDEEECFSIKNNMNGPFFLTSRQYKGTQRVNKKTPIILSAKTAQEAAPSLFTLHLPTAPSKLILKCDNKHIHSKDLIYIKEDLKRKEIVIENRTQLRILHTLPRQNSYIHFGSKQLNDQSRKSFQIHNWDALLVTLTNNAYQKSLYFTGNNNPVSGSKIAHSATITLRGHEQAEVSIPSSNNDQRVISSTLIITIEGALRKIKIHPNNNDIQEGDVIFIKQSQDGNNIIVHNQKGITLASIPTENNTLKI